VAPSQEESCLWAYFTGMMTTTGYTVQQGSRVFQHEELHPSFRASLRVSKLYRGFVSRYGSTDCAEILSKANKSKNSHFCEEIARSTSDLTLDLINA
jgi:hypothetical protein